MSPREPSYGTASVRAMDELDYYRSHSRITEPGAKQHLLTGLPADPAELARVIGGVMVHRDQTWRFGFALPQQRRDEANTRYVEAILSHLGSLDERRPEERFAGTCRDFTVLLCALLRDAGVPARARAGFAGYFTDTNGFFDDHWVVEVWTDDRGWHLVDAQVASAPKGTYTDADVDPLNVPRDAFLVGGQAWLECRSGRRDLDRIGTSAAGLTGMWEVQGNVIRDLASLNHVETLPWDEWGLIPVHYAKLGPADIKLLDDVAAVSAAGAPRAGRHRREGSVKRQAPPHGAADPRWSPPRDAPAGDRAKTRSGTRRAPSPGPPPRRAAGRTRRAAGTRPSRTRPRSPVKRRRPHPPERAVA